MNEKVERFVRNEFEQVIFEKMSNGDLLNWLKNSIPAKTQRKIVATHLYPKRRNKRKIAEQLGLSFTYASEKFNNKNINAKEIM